MYYNFAFLAITEPNSSIFSKSTFLLISFSIPRIAILDNFYSERTDNHLKIFFKAIVHKDSSNLNLTL